MIALSPSAENREKGERRGEWSQKKFPDIPKYIDYRLLQVIIYWMI